jgi:hypothetical protein
MSVRADGTDVAARLANLCARPQRSTADVGMLARRSTKGSNRQTWSTTCLGRIGPPNASPLKILGANGCGGTQQSLPTTSTVNGHHPFDLSVAATRAELNWPPVCGGD